MEVIRPFRYNPNYVRRDSLLQIDRNYWEANDWDDILTIDCIPLEILEILIDEKFLNPDDRQNRSPSAIQFLEFMRAHPGTLAHGYAVSPYRDDYRVTIEGLFVDCDSIIGRTYQDFLEFCREADRLDIDGDLYSWWD